MFETQYPELWTLLRWYRVGFRVRKACSDCDPCSSPARTWYSPTTQPSTLNPQPSTLNSQTSNLNPQTSNLNPQTSTLKPQPSVLNPQPSTPSPRLPPSTLSPRPQAPDPKAESISRMAFQFQNLVSSLEYLGSLTSHGIEVTPVLFSSLLLLSLDLSDTNVYAPSIQAFLGTASHFCKVVLVVFKSRTLANSKQGASLSANAVAAADGAMYRGTSLTRKRLNLGSYSRHMPRALWWS